MKKAVAIILAATLTLPSCMPQEESPPKSDETETETSVKEEEITDDESTRIAYYEQLVNELQEELLNLKTEMYVSRVEYESRLEALKKETETTEPPATDTPTKSLDYTYIEKDGTITITGYTGNDKQITLPAVIDDLPITAIADRAFTGQSKLIAISIPESVVSIGWFAFSGCVGLTSLVIPASVKTIEYGAFENCNSAMTVTCPDGSYAQQYARSYGFSTVTV